MQTAKALGFQKGDLVMTGNGGGFPAIVGGHVNTTTPLCEVYGFEHECGSAYANELRKVDAEDFKAAVAANGHTFPLKAYLPPSKKVLREMGC